MLLGTSQASLAALPERSGVLGAKPPPELGRSQRIDLVWKSGQLPGAGCTGSSQPCSSRLEANSWQKGGTAVSVGCRRGLQKPLLVLSDCML